VVDPFLAGKDSVFKLWFGIGLFRDRIFGSVDYYSKESVDLIYDKPLPGSGNTEIITNVG
jgi:hypothetical protein